MKKVGTLYLKDRVEIYEIFEVVRLLGAFEKETLKRLKMSLLMRVIGILAEPVPSQWDFLPWRRDKQGKLKIRFSHLRYINEALDHNKLLNGDTSDENKSSFSEKAFMRLLIMLATKLSGKTGSELARNLTQDEYVYTSYCVDLKDLLHRMAMFSAASQGEKYSKALNAEYKKLESYLKQFDADPKSEKKGKMASPKMLDAKSIAVHLLEPC